MKIPSNCYLRYLYLLGLTLIRASEVKTIKFKSTEETDLVILSLPDNVLIEKYEIMEGKKGTDPKSFNCIYGSELLTLVSPNKIIVDISIAKKENKSYYIRIRTSENIFLTKEFIFDDSENKFKLIDDLKENSTGMGLFCFN